MSSQTLLDQCFIARDEPLVHRRINASLTSFSGLLTAPLHLQEQRSQVVSPLLMVGFFDKGQFPQMMNTAQSMRTGIALLAFPAAMHAEASEGRGNPNGIHRFSTAFGMHRVMGQQGRRAEMHPGSLTLLIQASLILVHRACLAQSAFDRLFHRLQGCCTVLDPAMDRSRRDGQAQDFQQTVGKCVGQATIEPETDRPPERQRRDRIGLRHSHLGARSQRECLIHRTAFVLCN